MPGFNGTGPLSKGPFTGKGQGYCISQIGEGVYRESGWSRRGGQGMGVGRGRRSCRNMAVKPFRGRLEVFPQGAEIPEGGRQELDSLRERVKKLEAALELATKKIDPTQETD